MSDGTGNEWNAGYVVAGRYRIVSELGRGGMGSVWRAEHVTLDSPVAVKVIDPAIATTAEALARFMREAKAAAALRSPHVVQIFDYGVHEGVPYIAMEMLVGQSLADRLQRVGKLSGEETARIITHVARAIGKAHDAGIVHRDLKPDNIFLVRNEDEEVGKVLDFGIAKATAGGLGSTSQTRTGALLGTPYYMSPEQAEGNKDTDHRTDIWAMGVIAFECVVGRRPFESDALGDLVLQICSRPIPVPSELGEVPAGFDDWFARATNRDKDQRFGSAREMSELLREIAGDSEGRLSQELPEGQPLTTAPTRTVTSAGAKFAMTTGQAAVTEVPESRDIPKQPRGKLLLVAAVGIAAGLGTASFSLTRNSSGDEQATASASAAALEVDAGTAGSKRETARAPDEATEPTEDMEESKVPRDRPESKPETEPKKQDDERPVQVNRTPADTRRRARKATGVTPRSKPRTKASTAAPEQSGTPASRSAPQSASSATSPPTSPRTTREAKSKPASAPTIDLGF